MDHFYASIPGWAAFSQLYLDAVKRAPSDVPSQFVEVGSWLGRSAALMGVEIFNSKKPISFACVDPWTDGGPDLRDTKYFKDLTIPPYEAFLKNTLPVQHLIKPLRMGSVEASEHFAQHSVDFLMLDGDHSYEAVKADIVAWYPKMKPGGVMSGDDYLWPGVMDAVKEAFGVKAEHHVKKYPPEGVKDGYLKSAAYWWVTV